ncbi:MAG: FliH/SctL family protein [Candidatus Binatia bacterium]|nr:FliH/SctL family protein [Candidatus Binatia bacterium]
MSRVVICDGRDDAEVRPYREVDVNLLLDGHRLPERWEEASVDSQEQEGTNEADASASLLSPALLSTLAPLIFLLAAEGRAAELVAEARQQAEILQQEAYVQGLAQGREEGREAMRSELLSALAALGQVTARLVALEDHLVARFTPQLVRLALEVAEKIVGKAVEEDPSLVASVLQRALAEVPHATQIRLWLHPADYRLLVELSPDLLQDRTQGSRQVTVCTSEEIGRGGCRVETELGTVDATIPVQLQEIRRQLLDEETEG